MFYTALKRKPGLRTARTAMLLVFLAVIIAACDSTPAPAPPFTVTTAATATGAAAGITGTATGSAPTVPALEQPTGTVAAIATATTQSGATTPTNAAGGQAQGAETPVASTEQPVAPEQNPVGDIPDSQAFVQYTSASGGYTLQVPEGWARTENGTDVTFVDKLDGVKVSITNAPTAPTAKTAPGNEIAALQNSGRAVQVTGVKDVQLPGGPAVLIEYTSNSDPNPVTGKQVRLENNSYFFFHSGKLATLTLWAPLGADNVDQWQQIAMSFKWK